YISSLQKIRGSHGNILLPSHRTKKYISMKLLCMKLPKGISWPSCELLILMTRLASPDLTMVDAPLISGNRWDSKDTLFRQHDYLTTAFLWCTATAIKLREAEPVSSIRNVLIMKLPRKSSSGKTGTIPISDIRGQL